MTIPRMHVSTRKGDSLHMKLFLKIVFAHAVCMYVCSWYVEHGLSKLHGMSVRAKIKPRNFVQVHYSDQDYNFTPDRKPSFIHVPMTMNSNGSNLY